MTGNELMSVWVGYETRCPSMDEVKSRAPCQSSQRICHFRLQLTANALRCSQYTRQNTYSRRRWNV